MSEVSQFFLGLGLVLSAVLGTGAYSAYLSNTHEAHMASLGYVEQQALGSATTIWVKGDVCK